MYSSHGALPIRQIAKQLGLSRTLVFRVLNGDKKSYRHRPAIAELLGIPGEQLWGKDWLTPGKPGRPRKENSHAAQ